MEDKGFSLIEVLIAMSILTIGILSVVFMQTTALKVQSRNKISANVQLTTQEIVEKIMANAIDDATILAYNGIKTNDNTTKPLTSPVDKDFDFFKDTMSKFPEGWVEISVINKRPYPLKVISHWKEGIYSHKLEYETFILPH